MEHLARTPDDEVYGPKTCSISRCRIVLCLVLVGLVSCQRNVPDQLAMPRQKAPKALFDDSHGVPTTLESLRGSIVILDWWATWCRPCQQEMPILINIARRYNREEVRVLGISGEDEDWADVEAFGSAYAITFPLLRSPASLARQFDVNAFPTIIFIDRAGRIAQLSEGALSEKQFSVVIDRLRTEQTDAPTRSTFNGTQ